MDYCNFFPVKLLEDMKKTNKMSEISEIIEKDLLL